MAKKPSPDQRIIDAALDLAAERGWAVVSLADIAAQANLSLPELLDHVSGKRGILEALNERVDQAMIHGEPLGGQPLRDRLFDVLMRRFDALQPKRDGVVAVLRDAWTDPLLGLCGSVQRSMALALETAGLSASGLSGCVRVQGVGAVYLYALRGWMQDDSPDMARTMAALDGALRRAETLAASVWRTPQGAAVEADHG